MNILKTNVLDVSGKQRNYPKKKDLKTREHKGNDNVVKFEHSSEPLGNSRVVRKSAQIEDGYSQYLCFNIIIGSNNLIPQKEYSDHQQQNK